VAIAQTTMSWDSGPSSEQVRASEEAQRGPSYEATSTPHSLSRAVYERRAEYTRQHTIKIKVGTWNVAACIGVEKDIKGWFVEGKGIDKRLTGLKTAGGIDEDHSEDHIESVESQEVKATKKLATLPRGDDGTVIGDDHVGLYVLGLQEIVELASAKEYIGRVYVDTNPLQKWKRAMADAVPKGYELVSEQQLSGLLLLVYASPVIAPTISNVSSVAVGTGIMGYLGNKGAVCTRVMLGETTRLVFVNCHLASGTDKAHLERRCWDVAQIQTRIKFARLTQGGVVQDTEEGLGEEDFAFWFGDLNFRLEGLPGDDIRRLLMLHALGEYDLDSKKQKDLVNDVSDGEPIIIHSVDSDSDDDDSTVPSSSQTESIPKESSTPITLPNPDDFIHDPHSDPASLQATLDSLLPHDQLQKMQKAKRAFHDGWREGEINFLPTYKYNVGSVGMFDSSEKMRTPSWCDRILFRTRRDKQEYDGKSQEEELARLKDEEMRARGIAQAAAEDDVLFNYDPEADSADSKTADYDCDDYDENADEAEDMVTKDGYVDNLHLDVYISHQRVLSSDHKPVDAVFTLRYDAVVPELKSKIHQEVARELDRAENDGRPGVTVLVDHSRASDADESGGVENQPPTTEASEGVDFGDVQYLGRKYRTLTIANTGQVPARFSFVGRPGEAGQPERVTPDWLSASFVSSDMDDDSSEYQRPEREVTLEPGETVAASLEVFVDDVAQVRALNRGDIHLDDVLVLRVTDGRDYFIPLRGNWLASCFGRSIDELIRIPEGGVRALVPPKNGKGAVNRGQDVCWSAPRELFKLTEAIESLTERVIADRDMIDGMELPEREGWPFTPVLPERTRERQRIFLLEALDADQNLKDCFPPELPSQAKLEISSEVLILFLKSLEDGIVPAHLWDKIEVEILSRKVVMAADEMRSWVLDILSQSPNHNISMVFLMATLSKVAADIAPIVGNAYQSGSAASKGMDFRRSLSYKGRRSVQIDDAGLNKRREVQRAYARIFAPVVIRGGENGKDRERKACEERKRDVVQVFLEQRDG
jgi:phosphatidylinositol-bisphosphatase